PAPSQRLAPTEPSSPDFAAVRARHRCLAARLQVAEGKLPGALQTLAEVSQLAPRARSVLLDAQLLTGQVLSRLRHFADAERSLAQTLAAARDDRDRYRELLALNNLGMGRLSRNRFDEALGWFEQAL